MKKQDIKKNQLLAIFGELIREVKEESAGYFDAYEFKYGKKQTRFPQKFFDSYGKAEFKVINKNNFLEFVL